MAKQQLTYKEAGVDTKEAASLVGDIGYHVKRTQQKKKLFGAFGLFAAAYDLSDYQTPVIVTGCDGVGTKLEVLLEKDMPEEAGKDLVAMSVNDILTTGGDPLLFLDYIGVEKLAPEMITRLVAGMADYLESCDCILAGGETAEMPGVVPPGVVELAGFCIGAVEKEDLIDPSEIKTGHVVIGYGSDGFHANGWSLVRRALSENPDLISEDEYRELLAPTRLYHDVVEDIKKAGIRPKAMAHITGGGLPENLERILPKGLGMTLEIPYWDNEPVQKILNFADAEDRFNTFNMGIGWVVVVEEGEVDSVLKAGPGGHVIGKVVSGSAVEVKVLLS